MGDANLDACRACGERLRKSIFVGGRAWKSCPNCSGENSNLEHIYYPYPEDFGTTEERASGPNPDGPQSYCTQCRERGTLSGKRILCREVQAALARGTGARPGSPPSDPDIAALVGNVELPVEGARRLREHIEIERKHELRRMILDLKAARGGLMCEGCGQDPGDKYGPGYSEVLEVHHKIPLSRGVQQAEPTDFAVLCPTCHRVVHYGRYEPLSIGELKERLRRV